MVRRQGSCTGKSACCAAVTKHGASLAGPFAHLRYRPLVSGRLDGAFPRRAGRGARPPGCAACTGDEPARANHAHTDDGSEWLPVVNFAWHSRVSCQSRHHDQQPAKETAKPVCEKS